ncbi:hypothetical protein [Eubacterium sp.]|uniref:hypothetical protein n=1 Tax=Eubacterium sp. TaxID=142586 RepID=UPI002FC80FBF
MRFDTPIYFVSTSGKHYDPVSGEWDVGQQEKTKKYADMTHMGAQRQQAVFGDVRADRFVIRLQRAYTAAYECLEIDGKSYQVEKDKVPSDKEVLVVVRHG